MAPIVLGLGTSHGPMLSIRPESWTQRVAADQTTTHWYRGAEYSFDKLVEMRVAEDLAARITPAEFRIRHRRCTVAIDRLGAMLRESSADVGVIVGNDQMEIFTADHVPAFAVFRGDHVEGHPRSAEFLAQLPPGIAEAERDRTPAAYTEWPCVPELGRHIIESLMAARFDVAQLTALPRGERGSNAAPHAYSFLYRRLMRDDVLPHVPIFLNTFYPPNQPDAARCFAFGQEIGRAIDAWDSDHKVAIFASGGWSHFVIDEELDQVVLSGLMSGDGEALSAIEESLFQSGTSEVKNWIAVAGIMNVAGLGFDLVDYVPCYRSLAGTGNAMAFGRWCERV